jgi:hypothetical protein
VVEFFAAGTRSELCELLAGFVAAKEKATRAARNIRRKYGEGLSREEYIRLANTLRSAVVPRRKPDRRPKPTITAAYEDWKAGMRGAELYRRHIPGWAVTAAITASVNRRNCWMRSEAGTSGREETLEKGKAASDESRQEPEPGNVPSFL